MGWADLRGNRQYLSVGNLGASAKVSLLLMDYAHRRRLKIIGTAHVTDVSGGTSSELFEQLTVDGPRGKVERLITVAVHGYDWNCPQHITPRYTETELADAPRAGARRTRPPARGEPGPPRAGEPTSRENTMNTTAGAP